MIGGQSCQPVIMALRPAVFDSQVLSLDVSRFTQSFPEGDQIPNCRRLVGRHSAEEADHWHRLLLRAGCARPKDHRAAQDQNNDARRHIRSPHQRVPSKIGGCDH